MRHLITLAIFIAISGCKTTAPITTTPPTSATPHPWPIVHHDSARTGGSMDTPFQESPPAIPKTLKLPGQLRHFNAPVISSAGLICIGSIGTLEHEPDPEDGVYCIDKKTLTIKYFTHTKSDAYHTTLGPDHLFVTDHHNTLTAINLDSMSVSWTHTFPSTVTASPLPVDLHDASSPLLVADHAGNLIAFDQRTGTPIWTSQLEGGVIQGLASSPHIAIAATTTGHVYALDTTHGHTLWETQLDYLPEQPASHLEHTEPSPAHIKAAPVIAQDKVIIAYTRQHPQSTPPILALDISTGKLLWEASAHTNIYNHWQNQPNTPTLVEDRIIFVEQFSRLTAAISLETGDMLFLSERPSCIQEQRSSIVHAADISYVPRHDGTLYAMTQTYGISPWFTFPPEPSKDLKQTPYFSTFKDAYKDNTCLQNPPDYQGFITTPALTFDGDIVIGTHDGTIALYEHTAPQEVTD